MALKFKDYYETLGVARTATPDEIKAAFRKLARRYHPDVAKDKDKTTAEAKFKEINEANEVLSDPEKRKKYDELGENWQQAQGGPATAGGGGRSGAAGAPPFSDSGESFEFDGTGFSDFFETFFGGGRGGFGSFRRGARDPGREEEGPHRGQDIEADLLVTLPEALHGAVRRVTLRRPSDGTAEERSDTYQVRIPPGVHEGQLIRLAGQGWPGHGGGPAGDLYLRARLARHPDFTVQGADLYYDLDLAPWEAVLGAQVKIPALDGATSLRVPPGTDAGSRLRLRGLGLPRADGTRGDLYAIARLQTPPADSARERELWGQLAAASSFNPRSKS